MEWQRIQKVFRVCLSQERFFFRFAVEWMRSTLLTHSTNDGQNELLLFTIVGFSENQDRLLNDG